MNLLFVKERISGHSAKRHNAPVVTIKSATRETARAAHGIFTLSKCLCMLLGSKPGDLIEVAQDKDDGAWYLCVGDLKDCNRRLRSVGGYTLLFNGVTAARAILDPFHAQFGRFLVASKPVKQGGIMCYKIITSNPLYIDKDTEK